MNLRLLTVLFSFIGIASSASAGGFNKRTLRCEARGIDSLVVSTKESSNETVVVGQGTDATFRAGVDKSSGQVNIEISGGSSRARTSLQSAELSEPSTLTLEQVLPNGELRQLKITCRYGIFL